MVSDNAKVAGTINEAAHKDLAQAAAEIRKLLTQLEQINTNTTEFEKIVYLSDETTPRFKRRAASALKALGEAAIDELLDNPYVKVGKAAIKSWIISE